MVLIKTNDFKHCFVTGSDLKCYRIEEENSLSLQLISTEFGLIKSLEWSPLNESIAAISCNSGRVCVVEYSREPRPSLKVLGENIQSNRNCNVVRWSPTNANILLAGFDRYRGVAGLYFWDISRVLRGENQIQELSQYGASQAVSSAIWLGKSNIALAGMAFRSIRAFDGREQNNTPNLNIVTKSVFGLTSDPFNEKRFASFGEDGIIQIWDARIHTKPLLSIYSEFLIYNGPTTNRIVYLQ
jgi:WD40 repeat protein